MLNFDYTVVVSWVVKELLERYLVHSFNLKIINSESDINQNANTPTNKAVTPNAHTIISVRTLFFRISLFLN